MIRLVVVDDQTVVRDGLRAILEAAEDIDVVGEAADGAAAVDTVRRLRPDVVLMDVRMPILDGIEATRRITHEPEPPKVLMLSTFGEDDEVFGALRAGASGFLLKDAERGQIVAGVRIVAAGEQLLAPALTRRLIETVVRRRPPGNDLADVMEQLTERELDVTREVARGLSNAEIASALFVSPGTVKTHLGHVLQKLELRDRVQLVVLAYETGLIEPGT